MGVRCHGPSYVLFSLTVLIFQSQLKFVKNHVKGVEIKFNQVLVFSAQIFVCRIWLLNILLFKILGGKAQPSSRLEYGYSLLIDIMVKLRVSWAQ